VRVAGSVMALTLPGAATGRLFASLIRREVRACTSATT
jgi:hypothetical protein